MQVGQIIADIAGSLQTAMRTGEVLPTDDQGLLELAAGMFAQHYPSDPPAELCDFSLVVGAAIGRAITQRVYEAEGE